MDAKADNLQTPFMWAVLKGNIAICQLLMEHGADPCTRDSLGATPLILSVQHAQYLLFLFLLDHGANPDEGDVRGASAVHWAAYKGGVALILLQRLRERGGVERLLVNLLAKAVICLCNDDVAVCFYFPAFL